MLDPSGVNGRDLIHIQIELRSLPEKTHIELFVLNLMLNSYLGMPSGISLRLAWLHLTMVPVQEQDGGQ